VSNVLVLEAFGVNGPPIIDAVKRAGHRVIVASHRSLIDSFSPAVIAAVDEFWEVDYRAADIAASLIERSSGVDIAGVVTGWEFFTPLAAVVADGLGLPANDPSRVLAARNKKAMAEAFSDAGVRHARTTVVGPDDAIDIAAAGLDFPVVVKPADNAGSCGVSVVETFDELPDAIRRARSWPTEFPHDIPLDTDVLVQSYVGGSEYSVESVAFDGEFHHVAVTEKLTTTGSSRAELGHLVPARVAPDVRERIVAEVTSALRAVGFRYGVAHTEVKVDDGEAWIIETGVRPGGDLIPVLVHLAGEVDLLDAYVAAATGLRPSITREPHASTASLVRFIVPPHEGVVARLDNLPTGSEVVTAVFAKEPGDQIAAVSDNVSRLGHFVLRGDDPDALATRAEHLLGEITVELR
jgi:biotin carboxylase